MPCGIGQNGRSLDVLRYEFIRHVGHSMHSPYSNTEKEYGTIFQPIFISVDPARDSISQMKTYLADFHPRIIGLTGDYATVKSACKAYRVYFSTPPDADPKGDYLVDHSIYVYLMDPNGQFVEAFGQSSSSDEVVERVKKELAEFEKETGRKV
jgi:protein SCO1/2